MSHQLSTYLREQKEPKEKATFIGYCIAPFLVGWLFVWYNYVCIQWHIGYWQWVALSIPWILTPKWLSKPIGSIIGMVVLFAQVLSWLGLITLPLIKL